jgi:isochorismate hydrolase
MKRLIFCFDLDNVLCQSFGNNYKKSKPIKKNIKILKILKKQGHYIKIFTSRYMGRNNENRTLAKKQGYQFTKVQLKNWGVVYDELIFGKPSYDIFVDDKNLSFKKDWSNDILKKIKK